MVNGLVNDLITHVADWLVNCMGMVVRLSTIVNIITILNSPESKTLLAGYFKPHVQASTCRENV